MKLVNTELFPFPHYNKGLRVDGSIMPWPDQCEKCELLVCKKNNSEGIELCSYGYNYLRVTDSIKIAGILIKDFTETNLSRKKRVRKEWHSLITIETLCRAIEVIRNIDEDVEKDLQQKKHDVIERYIKDEQYKTDFLGPLKEDIQKGLSFVHDYKQINTAIRQNINVIIEKRYEGEDIEIKLDQADAEERAIYEASRFLDEKLNVAKFLLHPEWLNEKEECVRFKFHGLLMKYRYIYTPVFKSKNLKVSLIGKSYQEIYANSQAVQVIPHTFLDNAAKYSPPYQRVEIYVQDLKDAIQFSVSSYGPVIGKRDLERVFQPFFRTKSAQAMVEEGAGYGLYISQLIATNHLGTNIALFQDRENASNGCYWTTFSVNLPLTAAIL